MIRPVDQYTKPIADTNIDVQTIIQQAILLHRGWGIFCLDGLVQSKPLFKLTKNVESKQNEC